MPGRAAMARLRSEAGPSRLQAYGSRSPQPGAEVPPAVVVAALAVGAGSAAPAAGTPPCGPAAGAPDGGAADGGCGALPTASPPLRSGKADTAVPLRTL